jgi:hypothetical protein
MRHVTDTADWEQNTYAGLEELGRGAPRPVWPLGTLDASADDEPTVVASALPVLEELELETSPRLA